MKRALSFSLVALLLASCGQNPLLKIAGSDYAPIKVGASWSYADAAGSPAFERRITGTGIYQGRQAYSEDTLFPGLTTTAWVVYTGASIERYDSTSGQWYFARKLPLVTGNRWEAPVSAPTLSSKTIVEGTENLDLPGGSFVRCFRIRTETMTYILGNTVTSQTLAWVAPSVGDVQYGSLGLTGTVAVNAVLSSYKPGP